ncbi:MAG: sigma 54-interacting transcriptional regulator [Bacteroidota bacterium]|nr:sigma 54-interacting transcriptional regulator [Bacteroidota bacterium]
MTKYKLHIKILIVLISLLAIFIFRDSSLFFDQKCSRFLYKLNPPENPDTNIVIIHIDKTDIDNLGPWPLKRSYYALLIKDLTELNVKSIGIEIFLSDRLPSQSIYNDLLNNEIRRSGRVVVSSVVESYSNLPNSGTLILPQPKQSIPELSTGHLDYIENAGIFVPLSYHKNSISEDAFSLALAKKSYAKSISLPSDSLIKLNFFSSWKKFRNYTFLEFFNLFENHKSSLNSLKNKIVLVGLSDTQESASVIQTSFDNQLPGIGLHAFALDNILNKRYIRTDYELITSLILIVLLVLLAVLNLNFRALTRYLSAFVLFFLISYLSLNTFYIQLDYSVFLIPWLLVGLFDLSLFLIKKNIEFTFFRSEAEKLKIKLKEKETRLSDLEKELELAGIGSLSSSSSGKLTEKISALKNEIENLKLQQEDQFLNTELQKEMTSSENFFGIIYKSIAMQSVVSLITKVAPTDATTLILGESGTGKELVARAIHQLNDRRKLNAFVAVNCAALSDTLLESELFGHVKGAFTNAIADKIGRFEAADKGTIFLDEIGETSENFQVKLLRILQTGEFEKVGSSKTIKTDVRVIAATNKNLEELVNEKKFREDLYYRLNVIKIELPPLRDRKEDINAIASFFLSSDGPDKFSLSKAASDQLNKYDWRGNVRELQSALKRAMIFAGSAHRDFIKLSDLPEEIISKDKSNLETMILESLREKKFSHSSINETAKELGSLSRAVVSENFRGIAFRTYCIFNFDLEKTILELSQSDDLKVQDKVRTKVKTFLCNIEDDVNKLKPSDFQSVKGKLNSKYKNLPQKYHSYLDQIIIHLLK